MNNVLDPDLWSELPFAFWAGVFFLFGSMVGSFLNVCIYRMPREISIIKPPSHCPHCDHRILWHQNLPILSWLFLRGRCAQCRQNISAQYFIVELLTALLFLVCWFSFGESSPTLAMIYAFLLAGWITATFIDIEHFIIPDEITFGGIALGFLCSTAFPELHNTHLRADAMQASFFGILVGTGMVYAVVRIGKWLFGQRRIDLEENTMILFGEEGLTLSGQRLAYEEIFYRKKDEILIRAKKVEMIDRCFSNVEVRLSQDRLKIGQAQFAPQSVPYLEVIADQIIIPREAMGLGDVKFMGSIGAFLGWQASVFALVFSSMIGALAGIGLIAIGKREWSSRLPYGPYLALAAAVWIFLPASVQETWIDRLEIFIQIFNSNPILEKPDLP